MEFKKSIRKRRIGVVITFLSLLCAVSIFEYGKTGQWNIILQIAGIISLITFLVSVGITFYKTGLWKFTHKPIEKLDEREIALTSKSLRYAYAIFTVIVLLLLLSFSLIEKPINVVLVASLIIFAHILPASIIAWTEENFENE
ncbi:MAG: hypothetical protein U9R19_10185 [Bacteroidota bacterium]|nr:hypothetical protein [Bacteroidota bacterium]